MSSAVVVNGLAELEGLVGRELGPSEPLRLDQAVVDRFAEATGDRQWIHTDPARAAQETPWGGTIAHGYLVLSLVPVLLFDRLLKVQGVGSMINYGAERLRFPDVARVDAELTLRARLDELSDKAGGKLGRFTLTFEATGSARPCCAAEILILFQP